MRREQILGGFLIAAAAALLPDVAAAHLGVSHVDPATGGLVHDPAGLDHLLAMGLLAFLAIIGVRAVISWIVKGR